MRRHCRWVRMSLPFHVATGRRFRSVRKAASMIDGGSAVMSADYAGPARGRAYDQWIEELCRRIFQLDFVPRDAFLNSHVVAAVLPDVTLASCTATPTRIESSKSAGDRDDIVF